MAHTATQSLDHAAADRAGALPTIGERLGSRENNFDFIRLLAAFAVIVGHSWPLRDGHVENEPMRRLSGYCTLGEVAIATFFIISGMLVARSYLSDPSPRRYLFKRFVRIFPGLIACVAFCVLVIGPIFTHLPLREYFFNRLTLRFTRNALLIPNYFGLPGVFSQYPVTDLRSAVNGSLWSLPIEFLMYLIVLLLGATRLLRRQWCLVIVASAMLFEWLVIERISFATADWQMSHAGIVAFVDKYRIWLENTPQLGFLFFGGTLMLLYKDSIVLDWRLFTACLLVVAASLHTSHGFFLLSVCMPYLVMYLAFAKVPILTPILQSVTKRGDFSYGVYLYGYPVQQMLLRTLGDRLPFPIFIGLSCLGALILAYFSWHLVEKPFMKLKKRSTHPEPRGFVPVMTDPVPSPAAEVEHAVRPPVGLQRTASVMRQVVFFV